jgi:hypothetical protein
MLISFPNPQTPTLTPFQTIEFRFYPANHSVVRAEYNLPCIPYEMTGPNKPGFFSGFHAVDKVLDDVRVSIPFLYPFNNGANNPTRPQATQFS